MPPASVHQSRLDRNDRDFLCKVAQRVLGVSAVAGTNAAALLRFGTDAQRVARLVPGFGSAVQVDEFVFKKIEPDPEEPENYGLFVRRTTSVGLARVR